MSTSRPSRPSVDVQHQYKVLGIYLELAQYPILARRIRELMRQELFSKGFISVEAFEAEVKAKAIYSQRLEGMADPLIEEPTDVWNERLAFVRDQLTDFYFAYNLPHDRLEEIIQSVLAGRVSQQDLRLTFNPELAPWDLLFAKGEEYENLPPEELARVQHHLREIIVVLIKGMISDQLAFVGVAKERVAHVYSHHVHSQGIHHILFHQTQYLVWLMDFDRLIIQSQCLSEPGQTG